MPDPIAEIRGFLQNWKPFASLPPNDALREEIFAFLSAGSADERKTALARVNSLYKLHTVYRQLGILREAENAKVASFTQLIELSPEAFAEAIRNQQQKPFLLMILDGFEFDRAAAPPNQLATRQFLSYFWNMRVGDPPIKYGVYSNGIIYSAGGKTHDELARDFTQKGFGSGMPMGGGFMQRQADLHFVYDTYSQFVKSGSPKQLVLDSTRRWIRSSGADDTKIKLTYAERLG
jgi:hypothetical protein